MSEIIDFCHNQVAIALLVAYMTKPLMICLINFKYQINIKSYYNVN